MDIEWTEPAVADLAAIREYIARDSVHYARQFVGKLVLAAERLTSFPEMGRVVPEASDETIRELIVQAYRIIYRRHAQKIQILTVLHGSRDLAHREQKPWEVV